MMYFETKDLSVGYNGRPLIEHIDIGIHMGGILCLIGPNGSGKSTILRSITRHLAKLGGVVTIDGKDLSGMNNREMAKQVSVVLTDRVDPELLTCWEVVSAGRYPYTNHFGRLSEEDEAVVAQSMEQVNALELRDRRFSQLSDGQKQRILLARALCQQPESAQNARQALADYIRIVKTEADRRAGGDADPLLAATEKYKQGGKRHV